MLRLIGQRLLDLIYPRLCAHCSIRLQSAELILCCHCAYKLSEYHADTSIERLWASPIFETLYSLYYFRKDTVCQSLIHSYKYEHNRAVAKLVLKRIQIKYSCWEGHGYDLILAIPLSKTRQAKRGYNQALVLAQLIGSWLGVEASDQYIIKKQDEAAHAKLKGFERRLSPNPFSASSKAQDILWGQRKILLIDDLLTTGATLLNYLEVLEKLGAKSVDVFTIAVAK